MNGPTRRLVVRRGDAVTEYPFAQRVPCDEGLEFVASECRTTEPNRAWYEGRIAELEAALIAEEQQRRAER